MRTQIRIISMLFALSGLATAVELTPAESPVQVRLGALLDAETFVTDSPAPGLLFSDDEVFFNPRATLQYSYGHEGGPGVNADHVLATQVTFRL